MFAYINIGDTLKFTSSGKEYKVIGKTVNRLLLSGECEKFSITEANVNREMNRKKIELL